MTLLTRFLDFLIPQRVVERATRVAVARRLAVAAGSLGDHGPKARDRNPALGWHASELAELDASIARLRRNKKRHSHLIAERARLGAGS